MIGMNGIIFLEAGVYRSSLLDSKVEKYLEVCKHEDLSEKVAFIGSLGTSA
jgi:hypothetical protein